jgi:hypothetical protein
MEKLPQEPFIDSAMLREFDTVVVEMPALRVFARRICQSRLLRCR